MELARQNVAQTLLSVPVLGRLLIRAPAIHLRCPLMDDLDFLTFDPDFTSPQVLSAYDELPLWSAMFGLLLLEEVPLAKTTNVLDVGCRTGFPLIELAERLGARVQVHCLDTCAAGLKAPTPNIATPRSPNVSLLVVNA